MAIVSGSSDDGIGGCGVRGLLLGDNDGEEDDDDDNDDVECEGCLVSGIIGSTDGGGWVVATFTVLDSAVGLCCERRRGSRSAIIIDDGRTI